MLLLELIWFFIVFLSAVSDAAALETDLENPLTADPSDPHIFYNFRFPMTCGELCFNGSGCGACEEEPAA